MKGTKTMVDDLSTLADEDNGLLDLKQTLKNFWSFSLENVPCLCGHNGHKKMFSHDRDFLPHPTVICTRCGLIRANPRLPSTFFEEFYSGPAYRNHHEGPDFLERVNERFENSGFIYSELRKSGLLPQISNVLEIGCGGGWNLLPFKNAGKIVSGIEPNRQLSNLGNKRGLNITNESFFPGKQCAREQVDLIILNHVLEHLDNPVAHLKEMMLSIKPGKYMYIGVPNINNFDSGQFQLAHNYYFSPNTLMNCADRVGLKLVTLGQDSIHMFGIFRRENTGCVVNIGHNSTSRKEFHRLYWKFLKYRLRQKVKTFLS